MRKSLLMLLLCLTGLGAMEAVKAANIFYGVLESDGETLRCYYDDKMEERGGANIFKDEWRAVVTNAIFDKSVKDFHPKNSVAGMFTRCVKLKTIDNFEYLNTEDVKDMSYMFNGCRSLESINLSKFKTGSDTTMRSMFRHCSSLKSIDVSGFDTHNVRNMRSMFDSCVNVTTIDVSKFETYNVTDMQQMFYKCSSLTYLDVNGFNTHNVRNMSHMFHGCSSLSFLYVDNFDTGDVTTMRSMFNGCSGIGMLDVRKFNTGKVKDMSYMFYNCSYLYVLDCKFNDTRDVTNMSYMFKNCKRLPELDLYRFNVQNVDSMLGMFENCSNLETIYTDKDWKSTSKTTSAKSAKMFSGCEKLTGGYGTKYDAGKTNIEYARPDKEGVKGYFTDITETHEVYGVLSADGKTFTLRYDEDRVANKGVLPAEWGAYEYIEKREKVETIVLDESMDMAIPNKIAFWFDDFYDVTSVQNIQYLHTDNVTDMRYLFNECAHLTSIDLSGFNTSGVTKMKGMFKGCKALKELDLNSFDMSKVTDAEEMFSGCKELTTIRCRKDWSSLGITQSTDMFKNCNKLVGCDGTAYDEAHLDVSYALPDGKNGKKGYFTAAHYQVTFVDYNGEVLLVETVLEGDDAKGPETNPEREGYDFTGWDQPIKDITADLTVTATYTLKRYVVTILKPAHGDIVVLTEDIDLNSVERGTVIFLEAVPDEGYGLVGWTNYVPETGLEVTSDITITATFGVYTYRVTVDDEIEHGEIHLLDVDIDLANVLIGTTLHFEAVPDEGYELDYWINYNEKTGLKVTSDVTVSAVFKPKTFVVTLEAAENGHIEVDEEGIDLEHVPYGTVLHFTAVPDEGYELDGWQGGYDPDEGLKVTKDVWVAASFKVASFVVTFVDYNDDILHMEEVEYGHDATPPADPERAGYTFIGWDGDYTNVTEDRIITAMYEKGTGCYTLTVIIEPEEGGTVYLDGKKITSLEKSVEEGTTITLDAVAADDYEFAYFKDGKKKITDAKYKVTMTEDKTIVVYFEEIQEGIEEIIGQPSTNGYQKVLHDGVLYILTPEGKIYTAQGARVE